MFRAICLCKEFTTPGRGADRVQSPTPCEHLNGKFILSVAALASAPSMCLTGGFALTLMLEPAVITLVLSQP